MENLTYVTGNYGKYVAVKEKFESRSIDISYYKIDFEEPEINDVSFISREKARLAYEELQKPLFVADTGFYIINYPGCSMYPGAFVKRSGISSDVCGLLKKMVDIHDRRCFFLDCLTFYDGTEFYQFLGKSEGTLAWQIRGAELKKAKSNLWEVFIPRNSNKTLAEMSDYERNNRDDGHTSATELFLEWYLEKYKRQKKKVLVQGVSKNFKSR